MKTSHIALSAALLVLAGAGCLGGGSSQGESGGFFLSADSGKTWTQSVAMPTAAGVGTIGAANILAIEIDPTDSSALYLGTTANGMLASLDGGTSWTRPEDELARSGAVVDVEVDPRDVCTYYVAKQDRVMKTTSCGREFDAETYVMGTDEDIVDLVIDWYSPNTIYVGTTNGDLLRSTDGGATWAALERFSDGIKAMMVSNADSRILLVGTRADGLYRSTDSGATWLQLEEAFDDYRSADKVYELAQSASGSHVYMSTKYGLFLSKDNGATWSEVPLTTAGGEVEITALAVDPNDGDNVIYGTSSTYYRSDSAGTAWTTEELPSTRAASVLLVSPDDANTVYLGVMAQEK